MDRSIWIEAGRGRMEVPRVIGRIDPIHICEKGEKAGFLRCHSSLCSRRKGLIPPLPFITCSEASELVIVIFVILLVESSGRRRGDAHGGRRVIVIKVVIVVILSFSQ